MTALRRAATVLVSATLAGSGAALVALAPPAGAATCTTNWKGPTTGVQSWFVAGNWSAGVPGSGSVACITLSGTYTVDVNSGASVDSVQVGGSSGTQTLKVDGASTSVQLSLGGTSSTVSAHGALALAPTSNGYALVGGSTIANSGKFSTSGSGNPAYVRSGLTNSSTSTTTISAPDTRQDSGTLTANSGAFTVSSGATLALTGASSFTQSAGSLAVTGTMTENSGTFTASGGTQSGQPVQLSSATLADSAGGGSYDVVGGGTLTGDIPAGQSVTVDGTLTSGFLSLSGATTVHGALKLLATANGYAGVNGSGSLTVPSGGKLTTVGASGSQPAYLRTAVTNSSGGSVSLGALSTVQDSGTLTSTAGSFTVSSGATLGLSGGSSFTQSAGTVAVTGSLSLGGGTYTVSGGAESGNPVQLSSTTLADTGGTGKYSFIGGGTLTGGVPAGQTVTVDGSATNVFATLTDTPTTVHGTLTLKATTSGYAGLNGSGSLTVASGGKLITTGGAGSSPVYLRTAITNATGGSVSIGSTDTRQDSNTLTSNSGSFAISSGAALALSGGSSFTQAAGTLAVTGALLDSSGTFTASGGTQSGNPVQLSSTTLVDSAGPGSYTFVSGGTLTGNIPTGQTVTVDGSATSVFATLSGSSTVHGTLALRATPSGYAGLNGSGTLSVASGGTLVTSGTASGTSPVYLRVPISNAAGGTVTIGSLTTNQDSGTADTNSGTFSIGTGAQLLLSSGSTLANASAGTLGVTVNAPTPLTGISGPGVSLAGTLKVLTVGSPAIGATFVPISGPVTGTFGARAFGPHGYAVTYTSGAVHLKATAVYGLSPVAITASKNIATGSITVATISSAGNGNGTYSASVNWGDGTANSTATVSISGSTGVVTAPSHTFTSSGSFVVTTSVNNTNGTMRTTSTTVVVPTLKITAVSPVSGPVAGGQTVTITGTGFTGATSVKFGTTAGTSLMVVSSTKITVKSPAHTAGQVDIRVTTPGGTSAVVAADHYQFM